MKHPSPKLYLGQIYQYQVQCLAIYPRIYLHSVGYNGKCSYIIPWELPQESHVLLTNSGSLAYYPGLRELLGALRSHICDYGHSSLEILH